MFQYEFNIYDILIYFFLSVWQIKMYGRLTNCVVFSDINMCEWLACCLFQEYVWQISIVFFIETNLWQIGTILIGMIRIRHLCVMFLNAGVIDW